MLNVCAVLCGTQQPFLDGSKVHRLNQATTVSNMSGSYECGCHLSGWNARVWFYLEYRFPGVDHVALRDHGNRRQLLSLCPHTESVVLWRKRSRSFDLWCLLRSWCSKSFLGTMWGCHDNPQPCNWISGPWHWINHDQCMCRRIFHDFLRSLLLVFLVLLGCFFLVWSVCFVF